MQNQSGICVFNTPIGPCAAAWSQGQIDAFELPAADADKTVALLVRRIGERPIPSSPPPFIENVKQRVRMHLTGSCETFEDIPLRLSQCTVFTHNVLQILRSILPGTVATYGEIAQRLGNPRAARAVGRAVGSNPIPLLIPCHRVVGYGGQLGGFSAAGGVELKARLLLAEGVVYDSRQAAGFAKSRSGSQK